MDTPPDQTRPQADHRPTEPTAAPRASGPGLYARWGKRVGVVGFWFFFIKGLLWLIIPGAIAVWAWLD